MQHNRSADDVNQKENAQLRVKSPRFIKKSVFFNQINYFINGGGGGSANTLLHTQHCAKVICREVLKGISI